MRRKDMETTARAEESGRSVLSRGIAVLKREGPLEFARRLVNFAFRVTGLTPVRYYLLHVYCKVFKSRWEFEFDGGRYRYFFHPYNVTFNNERCVEIPIARKFLAEFENRDVLEVGSVLPHYLDFAHDVVDKFEKREGVINEDIVDFSPDRKYDLVISISTLEHVGWDEDRDPPKIERAFAKLETLVKPGGKAVVTLPLGHNPYLDELLRSGRLEFTRVHLMKRVSRDNRWIELPASELGGLIRPTYGRPFPSANYLVIGVIEKNEPVDSSDSRENGL